MANVSVTPINMGDDEQQEPSAPLQSQVVAVTSKTSAPKLTSVLSVHCPTKNNNSDAITVSTTAVDTSDVHTLDAEVAHITQQHGDVAAVALRCKGTKPACLTVMTSQQPRPMSWEGELSDSDDKSNDICMMVMDEDSIDGTSSEALNTHLNSQTQQLQQQEPLSVHLPENLTVIHHNNRQHETTTKVHLLQQQRCPDNQQQHDEQQSNADIKPDISTTKSTIRSSTLTPNHSPLLSQRLPHQLLNNMPATPSPDSAIHSTCYSVFSSPTQSPLTQRHLANNSLLTTPNLSRNNSDASHSSCCSYSSVSVSETNLSSSSPTHSPIQVRHHLHNHNLLVYQQDLQVDQLPVDDKSSIASIQPGISRQQLINSPCPICGDKISGFHYGIFSCESCKGFFKRTVQNRKNYVCLRGAVCPVTVATRKKCPACRFEKCLQCGMKLEAIREDRTRGGRSTYQCSYSLPPSMLSMTQSGGGTTGSGTEIKQEVMMNTPQHHHMVNSQHLSLTRQQRFTSRSMSSLVAVQIGVPTLLQEIMDVEHLWHYSELELHRLSTSDGSSTSGGTTTHNIATHPLLAGTALGMTAASGGADTNPDFVANLCNIADHRLYKIVKWCKSLPLFKNISIDDQILLLINSWCELLLFSCCYRSMSTPGEIRVSLGKRITLAQARDMGPTSSACIERMLNFTEQLRRLRVDRYEYVAMKVIVLLTSDTSQSDLSEAEKVRVSQEKALKALQDYTLTHYPDSPAKFGELLLRIPELQRTCQVGKEMLTIKSKDGDGPSFNLLMELLRGDH